MKDTKWFLEPLTKEANKFIGDELASEGRTEENWIRGAEDVDNIPHDVWQIDFELMMKTIKSEFKGFFRVFGKRGNGRLQDKTDQVKSWLTPRKNRAKKEVEKKAQEIK